jgi:hypothetical protein
MATLTFEQFKAHLVTLHEREVADPTVMTVMYCNARDLGHGAFSFAYDGLCQETLVFNADGTVSEWCEADCEDHLHYEAHFVHASVEGWMQRQIKAITPPAYEGAA